MTGLEQFKALKTLLLAKTKVHTLKKIPPKIRLLSLDRCSIKDISAAQHAPNLRELILDSCHNLKPTHLSQLNPLLEQLTLRFCPLGNVDSLPEMPNLHTLNLKCANLARLPPLTKLVSLTSLNLAANAIKDFRALSETASLTALDISSCEVADLDFARSLFSLKQLTATSCSRLTSIKALEGCRNLERLDIAWTPITCLSGLENATSLETLNVTSCSCLRTLEDLPISRLKFLLMSKTNIKDIRCLAGAPLLSSLNMEEMHQCKFDLSPLQTCPNFRKLDIRFCSFGLAPATLPPHVEVSCFQFVLLF
jgi:hypothetical protein